MAQKVGDKLRGRKAKSIQNIFKRYPKRSVIKLVDVRNTTYSGYTKSPRARVSISTFGKTNEDSRNLYLYLENK